MQGDKLKGRIILLTGASKGIGPFIARKLAAEGGVLAINARSMDGLGETIASMSGSNHRAFAGDIREALMRKALVQDVMDAFGRIDILINNAGVEMEGLFTDLREDEIADAIDINFMAPMHLARLVLPQMLQQGSGHVVNMSSVGGKRGAPYGALYCGTKAALDRWAEGIRMELASGGVNVSTIFPGYVTGEGMFARFHMEPPGLLGSCNPQQVANAVYRSIIKNKREIIVNSTPIRPLVALGQLFPALGDAAVRILGIPGFQQRKIEKGNRRDE